MKINAYHISGSLLILCYLGLVVMDADGCMSQLTPKSIERRHSRDHEMFSNPTVDDNYNDYYDNVNPKQLDDFEYVDPLDYQEAEIHMERPISNGHHYRKKTHKKKTFGYRKNKDFELDYKYKKKNRRVAKKVSAGIVLGTVGVLSLKLVKLKVVSAATVTTPRTARVPLERFDIALPGVADCHVLSTTPATPSAATSESEGRPTISSTTTTSVTPEQTTLRTTTKVTQLENLIFSLPTKTPVALSTTTHQPLNSIPCTTVRSPVGSYVTGRNTRPFQPIQCLAVTVPIGLRIQLTCTSVFSLPSSSVTIIDLNGKNVIANPPVAGRTYTTRDNTLIIKSMASGSDNKKDRLHCEWESIDSSDKVPLSDIKYLSSTLLMLNR